MHVRFAPLKKLSPKERKYHMKKDNRRVVKSTIVEVLKNLEKIFSNLDNSLFYMDLKP